jgi:hypothetical protein
MLGDGESVLALGLAVPARDAGQAVRNVLDFDVQRRRIEQVEPAAAQHPLPGARLLFRQTGSPYWTAILRKMTLAAE